MDRHEAILGFLSHCHRTLAELTDGRPADAPERRGTDALGAAIERATPRAFEPSSVPVLGTASQVHPQPAAPTAALARAFTELADDLRWVPTRRATDGGTRLALAPFDEMLDLGETVAGLMYVGPGATYPLHHHPPQELYLTIAGNGRWRYGGADDHRPVGPGEALYNHPDDLHSSTAGEDEPIVALYVLW